MEEYKSAVYYNNNGYGIMSDVCPVCGQAHNNEYMKMDPINKTFYWICPETYKKILAVYA